MGLSDFIHHFVPAHSGGARFTLLLLHGTGGSEDDLIPLGGRLAPGAALLSPRGHALEHGMARWFRRFAEGVFDIEDLKARSRDLARFIADAAGHYGFDPARVVPVGYSNGANIAAAVLLLDLARFPAAVLFRPMIPLVPEEEPDLAHTQIFIGAGTNDPMVSAVQTAKLAELFESAGAKVEVNFASSGHHLTSQEIEIAARWLQKICEK